MHAFKMNTPRLARLTLVFALACIGVARAQSPLADAISFIFRHDVNVVTVTDFTEAGRKLPVASREQPVYFEALILGYHDWGWTIAAERIPDKNSMIRLIFKVLADRGYFPATRSHPPSLILAMAWGSMNNRPGMSLQFMGGDKLGLMWELDPYIGSTLDARVLTRGMRGATANLIMESVSGDLYVASIQAFDEEEARQGRTVLVWHTKISCPAEGLAMDSSLRKMIRVAGPNIGRDTPQPVITTEPVKATSVEIGEMKVIEMIDVSRLPVTDISDRLAVAREKSR